MPKFDFLKQDKNISFLADSAISAEQFFNKDYSLSIIACRKTIEKDVNRMYCVDNSLITPFNKDNLMALINTDEFKNLVGENLYKRLNYIRIVSNNATRDKRIKNSFINTIEFDKIKNGLILQCLLQN